MDTVYNSDNLKLGALEIGFKENDSTKDICDVYLKLPMAMKDMIQFILEKHTGIRHDIGIDGCSIQNNYLMYGTFHNFFT